MKDFIEKLKDRKTLLICPNVFKNRVLEHLFQEKEVFDIKFIDLNEYKKNILFDYDLNAVRYLNSKYGLSVSNAREILENLYFVEDKRYGVKKLDELVTYKTELEQEGLLIHNRLFDRFLEGRDIVIAGYGEPDKFTEGIVKGEIIPYEEIKKIYKINTFEDIEAELEYVYNSISDLIRNGTDINKIHVLNAGSDYEAYISRFNTYYGFVIDQGNNEKLIGTSLAKDFLDKIDSSDKQTIYEDLLAMENDLADKFINIINRYTGYDLKNVKEFIIDDLKNTGVSSGSFNNVVSCDDLFTPFDKDDHVFLIGFNEQFPRFKTDTEYISNSLRPLLNMSTIEEENELIRKNVRGYLSSIDNLHISWCEKSPFRKYNQCNLYTSEECEYRKIDTESYGYSNEVNRLKYAYMQDRLQKYGRSDDDYGLLHKEYGDNDYLTYSNVFKGLNDEQINQFNSVKLSYTPMNDFYLCQFRYYLDYVMKIGDNSGNFNTRVGNICHEVLKDLYEDKDFDFERSWDRAFKNEGDRLAEGEKLFEDESEEFFVQKIKDELKDDIEIIEQQKQQTLLDKQLCEQYVRVKVTDNVSFDGKIDKVMYREGKEDVIANVVDYKTGSSSDINRNIMEYGLSLQLPSYMYLLSKRDLFKGKKISYSGFYLQHLVNNDYKFDADKTLADKKAESMKLQGFSSDDLDRLEISDPELTEGKTSRLYKSLRKKNDGSLYGNCSTISDEEIKEKIDLVEEKIKEAAGQIMKGDFRINPKLINNKNASCDYCPYEDICYRRVSDYDVKVKEASEDAGEMD